MLRLLKVVMVVLFVVGAVFPIGTASVGMANVVFADKAADTAAINALFEQVEDGSLTLEQALASALKDGLSFSVIIEACNSRNIALSNIITAASTLSISSEAILAWMADANVPAEQMSAAIAAASGTPASGLGYTPDQTTRVTTVVPLTTNPGNTLTPNTVSPSAL